jgi:hypothetical protein
LSKPLSKKVPIFVGRKIRKWWKNLSEEEKTRLKKERKKF